MSQPPIFRFPRGEPIAIVREVLEGDPSSFTLTALLKPSTGRVVPRESVPAAATFQTEFVPASEGENAHWLLWIEVDEAAELPVGWYATDVRFSIDGETVEVTDPAWVVISESVSG